MKGALVDLGTPPPSHLSPPKKKKPQAQPPAEDRAGERFPFVLPKYSGHVGFGEMAKEHELERNLRREYGPPGPTNFDPAVGCPIFPTVQWDLTSDSKSNVNGSENATGTISGRRVESGQRGRAAPDPKANLVAKRPSLRGHQGKFFDAWTPEK